MSGKLQPPRAAQDHPPLSAHGVALTTRTAVVVYITGLVLANILVGHFGPSVTPVLGFLFVGLDLSLRDWLHVRIRPWQMGLLILAAGLITFALDRSATRIAAASSISFAVAAMADWFVFTRVRGSWIRKSLSSNVVGDLVDSCLFPCLAFGAFMPLIIAGQFVAKFAGSTVWSLIINRAMGRLEACRD